jgi:hypothetical protein
MFAKNNLLALPFRVQTLGCTRNRPYILGSCGVHYRNMSGISALRIHHAKDNVFPIWYVEYLSSSLWMTFQGQSHDATSGLFFFCQEENNRSRFQCSRFQVTRNLFSILDLRYVRVFYTYFLSRTQAVDDQLRAANILETGVLNVHQSLRAPPKSTNAYNSSSQNLMHPCKNQKSA